MKAAWWAASALVLNACMDQTSIQRGYISERNDCQGVAESRIGQFINPYVPNNEKDKNAKLVTLFSDCMFERGWTVAAPEREEEAKGAPGQGTARTVVVTQPQTQPQPQRTYVTPQPQPQPVQQPSQPIVLQPAVSQPAVTQPSAATTDTRMVPTYNQAPAAR